MKEPWFLKDTGFTRRMSEKDKEKFLEICPKRPYRKGTALFRMGDPAEDLHIILKGQVKLSRVTARGNERILAICGPDDFAGEAFLSGVNHYRADAVALSEVKACCVNHEQFRRLMVSVPNFIVTLVEILSLYLCHCREQLTITDDPIGIRIAKALIEQARRFGRQEEKGWYKWETELGHDDLAALVSASRVSVTTAISELRERGFLRGTRGVYRLNIPALESLLEA